MLAHGLCALCIPYKYDGRWETIIIYFPAFVLLIMDYILQFNRKALEFFTWKLDG